MAIKFEIIESENDIYEQEVTIKCSKADLIALKKYASHYVMSMTALGPRAALRFAPESPKNYYDLDYTRLFLK